MKSQRAGPLRQYINHHGDDLLRILRQYVLRFGLAMPSDADSAANDLLNDVVVQALNGPDHLPQGVEPLPWLLGIALNLIKRHHTKQSRRSRREPLVKDLYPMNEMSEDEIIDLFISAQDETGYETVDQRSVVDGLLAGASYEDAQLLRLAMRHHFDGQAMAVELGVSFGAARVRLHRALKRQRQRLNIQQDEHKP